MVHPYGTLKVEWHPKVTAGVAWGVSDPEDLGVKQARRPWKRGCQMGKVSADSGNVRSSVEMDYVWTGMGVWGYSSVREEG